MPSVGFGDLQSVPLACPKLELSPIGLMKEIEVHPLHLYVVNIEVDFLMTSRTEGNQVFFNVGAERTSKANVVDL